MPDDEVPDPLSLETPANAAPKYSLDPGHEPEVVDEPEVAPVVKAEPAAPKIYKHSRRLLSEAVELGLSDQEIDETPTDELDEKVYKLTRQRAREERSERSWQASDRPTPPGAVAADGTEAVGAQDAPPPQNKIDALLEKLKETIDPDAHELLTQLASELRTTSRKTGELVEFEARRARESEAQFIDRLFDTAARPEHFGKGGIRSITNDERMRRDAVLRVAQTLDPKLPPEKRFEVAVETIYGKPKQANDEDEPVKAELSNRLKDYRDGTVARPTSRTAPPEPPGDRRAVKEVGKLMGRNGQSNNDDFKV